MTPDRLLALYDRVADAPDAIPRLRNFVLDLAVRGKLVEQDPADEPASAALKRIKAAQKLAPISGRTSKQRLVDRSLTVLPFALPDGWSVAGLSELVRVLNGRAYKKPELLDEGTPVLRVGNLFTSDHWYYSNLQLEDDKYCDKGDLIYAWSASFGPFIWNGPRVIYHYHIWKLSLFSETDLAKQFLYLFLLQKTREIKDAGHGISMVHMTKEKMEQLAVPLPPLAEQHRIVAKVDELMALLDRLAAARAAREAARDRLTKASLARLGTTDPATFRADARFALETLTPLTTRPDQIKHLRQTILNLAVRGKLVAQDPNDEPASELLKRMVKERQAIVANRKIRGANPPSPPSAEKEGYSLPPTWQLCALGQVTLVTDPNPSHRYPDYSNGTVPILSTREFAGDDGWNPETAKLTTKSFWNFQKDLCDFSNRDIVFARKGRLGLPRLLPALERFTFSHTLFVIKPMSRIDPAYLLWLLRRNEVVEWLTSEMNQNTGVPTLGKAKTERLPIPLPPLAEQHRIVAKVDALMALCDRLEAALATADTTRRRLLEALLHNALTPTATPEMEAAE